MFLSDPLIVSNKARDKEAENLRFREILQQRDGATVDQMVFRLNKEVTPQIDCTKCGNCCKSLMINVDDADATYQDALNNGATVVTTLADQSYGRSGGVKDAFGNTWWITSVI